MHALSQDIRYALRILAKSPGLSAVIVVSLAIGIGANTAIFSVVDALLLRPLPYPQPERLAVLWLRSPGINIPQDWPSPGQYIDIQNENRSFEELAIARGDEFNLTGLAEPQRLMGLRTSSSLFHLLGAKALIGRLLLPEDDKPGQPRIAVLAHGPWQRLFGADSAIVGKGITLNGESYTVAGVLRPEFQLNSEVMPTVAGIERMEVFVPLPAGADWPKRRGDENYNVMGRLKPGVTMEQAQTDIGAIAARIREKDKRDRTFTISVVPLLDQVVGDVRRGLVVLLGSVALVLLIACANVANLLLSRAAGRQKEVAIRTALGAGWQRLVRQLLTESVMLGLLGGAAGLLIAKWALYTVRTVNPGNIPRLEAIALDGRVLAFTFVISILTGVVFGLAPAWRAARVDLNSALKAGGRSTQGQGGLSTSCHRLRGLLVVSELALSLMLLAGAGLLIRSFIRLQNVPLGFNPEHVISMRVNLFGLRFQQLAPKLASLPGVTMWGSVTALPFTASIGWGSINVEGFTPQPGQELQVDMRGATPDYFRTMEIPLVRGRFFNEQDIVPNAPPVAIIDAKFAQRFWPDQDPIGKQVWGNPERKIRIVGVVGTAKQYGLDIDGKIVLYRPFPGGRYLVARTTTDPAAAARAIVKQLHAIDPSMLVFDVRTMRDRLSDSMASPDFSQGVR
jgi:putative ABC transport system permease protein